MPEYKLGPGLRHAIMWVTFIITFLGGVYVGWNSRGSWGLQTELAVHVADSQRMKEIAEWLFNEELTITNELEQIDVKKIHDCGRMSMSDILQPSKIPDSE